VLWVERPNLNTTGLSPLVAAIITDDLNAFSAALAASPDLSEPDTRSGWSPLRFAAEHGRTKFIYKLIGLGAPVDERSGPGGWTALHQAVDAEVDGAVQGNSSVIQWAATAALLDCGADPSAQSTGDGATAHDHARRWGTLADQSFTRLTSAMQQSAFWNANRVIEALDALQGPDEQAGSALLQSLYEHSHRIDLPKLQQIIAAAKEAIVEVLSHQLSPVEQNRSILTATNELRLAVASIEPPT